MKPLIIANWKMNPATAKEAEKLFEDIFKGIKNTRKAEVVICPPYLFLQIGNSKSPASTSRGEAGEIRNPKLGAQNCFWEPSGPYTGEISPKMLKELGVEYVIIGHSERRNYLNETDEIINKKLKAVLSAELIPILCVGEKKGENAETVLENQLTKELDGISKENQKRIIVAYEPVWAISTSGGEICSADYAKKMFEFIKQRFNGKIIYGGSVDSKIINNYLKIGYHGALVGGASLKADEFIKIVEVV